MKRWSFQRGCLWNCNLHFPVLGKINIHLFDRVQPTDLTTEWTFCALQHNLSVKASVYVRILECITTVYFNVFSIQIWIYLYIIYIHKNMKIITIICAAIFFSQRSLIWGVWWNYIGTWEDNLFSWCDTHMMCSNCVLLCNYKTWTVQ